MDNSELHRRVDALEKQMNEASEIIRDSGNMFSFTVAGVKALMQTHPDKPALRNAWDHLMAQFWSFHMQGFADQGVDSMADELRRIQNGFEAEMR